MAVNQGSASQGRGKPQSVQGTMALLALQGAIWGLVCMVTFFWTSPSLAGQYGTGEASLTLLADAVLAGFAGGSFYLAGALRWPGRARARAAAICLEGFMTLFGLAILVATVVLFVTTPPSTPAQPGPGGPAVMVGLAGLVGAALSGASVRGMLGSAARQHCAPRP